MPRRGFRAPDGDYRGRISTGGGENDPDDSVYKKKWFVGKRKLDTNMVQIGATFISKMFATPEDSEIPSHSLFFIK